MADPESSSKLEHALPPDFKLHLQEVIDSRVDKRLDDAKKWLDTSIGWGIKILATAGALFVGAMAFFGFQTISEFKESLKTHNATLDKELSKQTQELKDTITKRADEKLKEVDPGSLYRTNLEDFYIKTLIAASTIQIAASKGNSIVERKVVLTDADRQKLISMFEHGDLDAGMFEQILQLLAYDRGNRSQDFGKMGKQLLTKVLDKKTEPEGSERKVSVLFRVFQTQGIADAGVIALEVAKDLQRPPLVRFSALRYLAEFGNNQMAGDIEELDKKYADPDKYMLLAPLARWRPDAPMIEAWLSGLEKQPDKLGPRELGRACEVVHGMMKRTSRDILAREPSPAETALDTKRMALGSRIARVLAGSKALIKYENDRFGDERFGKLTLWVGSSGVGIDEDLLLDYDSFRVFSSVVESQLQNKQWEDLNRFLTVVCVRNGNLRQESAQFATGLALTLGEKSTITLAKEASSAPIQLSKPNVLGNPLLLPGKNGKPSIIFRDQLGVVQSGMITDAEELGAVRVFTQALVPLNFQ